MLNSSGQSLWIKTSNDTSSAGWSTRIDNLQVDGNGSIFLSGVFYSRMHLGPYSFSNSQLHNPATFLTKLSSTGQWLWATKTLEIHSQKFIEYQDPLDYMVANHQGATYLMGKNTYPAGVSGLDTLQSRISLYLIKIDGAGTKKWIGQVWAPKNFLGQSLEVQGLAADKLGNVYVAGHFFNGMNFGLHHLQAEGNYIAKIRPGTQMQLQLRPDTVVYCNDSINLPPLTSGVSNMTYQWSPSYGLSDPKSYSPKASPSITTTYTVVATSMGGCSDSAEIIVRADSTSANGPTVSIKTSTGGTQFCNNSGLTLSTWGTFSKYMWSTGDTTATTSPKGPGTYSVVTIDSLGCYKTGMITLTAPKTITAPNKLVCQNDSVPLFLNSFGLDSLRWSNGHTGSTIYAGQAGTYWVTIYRGGCIYTDSVKVSLFTDTANARFSHKANLLEVSFSPISIGVATGRWSFGDGTFSNSIVDTHTYAAPGTYLVCFTATDICGFTTQHCDSVTVSLIDLPEIKPEATFSIYPNPTNGILNIESSERGNPHLRIVDLTGKVLVDRRLEDDYRWEINLSHLPQGYYFIRIDNQIRTFVKL